MLVEIPDIGVILNVILAFIVGLGVLYGYYKVRPFIKPKGELAGPQNERLEYYETQLIDMKIRLDALEMQGIEHKTEEPNMELRRFLEKLAKNEAAKQTTEISRPETTPERPAKVPDVSGIEPTNPTAYVLQLIINKAMTSRDIQVTLKKSREHTSRLMKKLFEEGLVERNTDAKPYTYSITEKGRESR